MESLRANIVYLYNYSRRPKVYIHILFFYKNIPISSFPLFIQKFVNSLACLCPISNQNFNLVFLQALRMYLWLIFTVDLSSTSEVGRIFIFLIYYPYAQEENSQDIDVKCYRQSEGTFCFQLFQRSCYMIRETLKNIERLLRYIMSSQDSNSQLRKVTSPVLWSKNYLVFPIFIG